MNKKMLTLILIALVFFLIGCSSDKIYSYDVVDCKIKNNEFVLDGKLTIPQSKKKVPCVILIAGSGPSDMNGTVNNQTPYKDISDGLAEKGIASLRYNKVTYQYNKEIASDYDLTIEDEYFYALDSAVDLVSNNENIDSNKIYLIGHSLGSQILSEYMMENENIAGGIIMAGSTMHLLDILLEQTKQQDDNLYNSYKPYCEYAKSLNEVPEGEEKYFYFGAYTAYYVSYNQLKRENISEIQKPLLFMQGKLDLQINIHHFENYKELFNGKNNATFKEYEFLNHLFTNGENETISNAYFKQDKVSDEVIHDIYLFIKNN